MKQIIKLCVLFLIFNTHHIVAKTNCQLIENIIGYTPVSTTNELQQFSWMAFADKKIIATGHGSHQYTDCSKIDGKGQFVLPGFIDAHGHVYALGDDLLKVKLRDVPSEQQAVKLATEFAKQNPHAKWIIGRGWNQVLWENKQFPDKKSLDQSGINRPVVLKRIDGHAVWVNSKALELAGITRSTFDPAGGKIVRNSDGEATGLLIDNAALLVENIIPKASAFERERTFDEAFYHLISLGIVSTHDAGVSEIDQKIYRARQKANNLPLRIYAMLDGASPKLEQWLDKGIFQTADDFLSIRSVKLYSDGALGSRGAALLSPYSDDEDNRGLLVTEPKVLEKLVETVLAKGFQLNVHAIGDRGNRNVLDAFEKSYPKVSGRQLRNRIEHAQVITLSDIPRFKELDIIASMQPVSAMSDKNMAGDRIGKYRLEGSYAWQKLLKQGTKIASSSDFPIELANVFYGLHAAITRQDRQNQPAGGWYPLEKMTVAQALRSYTLDAAYASHQEQSMGSLEPGKWADFILVDGDLVNSDPEDIWKLKVLETWIAGERIYELKNK